MVSAVDDVTASALADAEARAAAGDPIGALDALTAANRAHRHPALEARLVELRHRAFQAVDRTPGRAEWPPALADPFPDETGIPAVAPVELTGSVLGGALVHHGCLRVDGLLSGAQVARLVRHIDDGFRDRDRANLALAAGDAAPGAADPTGPGGSAGGAGASTFVPFGLGRERAEGFGHQSFVRAVDLPSALFDLAELFASTPVLEAVTDYLGERPAMIANKWVLRRSPSGKAGTDYHQDGAFLGEGIRTVDCWIALSDCGPGTGRPAIDLVPRRFPLLPPGEGAAFTWSITEATVHAAAPEAAVASPVFRAGDALFFDEVLPHRTSVGLDLGERYAIESWFVAPSSYPARHVPVLL